jgi:hypothetical protein
VLRYPESYEWMTERHHRALVYAHTSRELTRIVGMSVCFWMEMVMTYAEEWA